MPEKRVLIVEDEPDLSAVFANLLEIFGFQSVTADNAETAQNTISRSNFDFMIIDLTLPDRSGIDLYRDIVSRYPQYKGNAIFTSGFNVSDHLTEIMENDGAAFLAKPFTMDKLKKILDRWL